MNKKDLAERIIWIGEFNAGNDDKGKSNALNNAIQLITDYETELKKCFIGGVSISVARANDYARQQYNRGCLDLDLVEFKDWQH